MSKLDKMNFDRITPLMELVVLLIPFVGAYLVVMEISIGKYWKLYIHMKKKRIRLFLSIYLTMLAGYTIGFTLTRLVNDTIFGLDSEMLIPILFWALSLIVWELTFYKKFKKQFNKDNKANN